MKGGTRNSNILRILIISHLYPRNTDTVLGNFVHLQVKHLLKEGCQVRVISPVPYAPRIFWTNPRWRAYGQTRRFDSIEGIPVYYPKFVRLPGGWFRGASSYTLYQGIAQLANSIVKEFQPHILHAYNVTPDGYAGLVLSKKHHIPLVVSLLGDDINIYPQRNILARWLTQLVISRADQLISVSQALKDTAEALAKPKRDIRVVYMGCDITLFQYNESARQQLREALGIAPQEKVILFVGAIQENKGILELVEAFTLVKAKQSNVHLIFVGKNYMSRYILEVVREKRLNNVIHFVGQQPHHTIPAWMSAADLVVLPSHHEGLPNVVIEAMACQRPVIATKVGGIPEAVENGKSGLLVDKGDILALSNAISELIKDPHRRQAMGSQGRMIVERKFTWEKSAKCLREVYEDVLSKDI